MDVEKKEEKFFSDRVKCDNCTRRTKYAVHYIINGEDKWLCDTCSNKLDGWMGIKDENLPGTPD
jgi:hypothetical protein